MGVKLSREKTALKVARRKATMEKKRQANGAADLLELAAAKKDDDAIIIIIDNAGLVHRNTTHAVTRRKLALIRQIFDL